jgi:hypothetical protein
VILNKIGNLMLFKRLIILLVLSIISACSSVSKNNRYVASLDDVSPGNKGACVEVIKTFIGKKKIIKKKGLSNFFPSKKKYNLDQMKVSRKISSSLSEKKFSTFSQEDLIKKFQTFSYTKFSTDSSKEIDAVDFNKWFQSHLDDLEDIISSNSKFEDGIEDMLPMYKKWHEENGFSFKNISKIKKSKEIKAADKLSAESAVASYNKVVDKTISSYSSYDQFIEDAASSIANFHIVEENFQGDDFLRWLSENDLLSRDFYNSLKTKVKDDQTMGDFLSGNYSTFLPFSKKPLGPKKSIREKIQDTVVRMFNKKQSALELCGDDADCIARESRGFFEKLIGMDRFKKSFSCLRQFPQARNAMYVDFVTTWAMLGYIYKSNEDEFQRFPWEIATNGLIFTPIMSEVNCQASFQTRNAFGGAIDLAKQPSRVRGFLKSWRRVAGVSLVSGVSLVGLGVAYNELYASMGVPVENTESLQEQMKMLPFMFMWSGVLGGLKNIAITNPLKYKVIPKLAAMIQTKTGVVATGVASLTALNFTFSGASEYYESWSFNEIWRYHVLPKYLEIAGYDHPGDQDLNGKTSVTAFDENRDIYITEYENGVSTSVTVEKSYDEDGKEYIKVEDIDLEIPDYILEESVEDIPKAN